MEDIYWQKYFYVNNLSYLSLNLHIGKKIKLNRTILYEGIPGVFLKIYTSGYFILDLTKQNVKS